MRNESRISNIPNKYKTYDKSQYKSRDDYEMRL